MIVRGSIVILLAGFSFCNPKPPDPPKPECLPDIKWCHEVGQTCSTPEVKCKHNPTTDPDYCELAPDCPVIPTPEPKCKEGQNCDCYAYVEVMDSWQLMSCSDPKVCKNFVCTAPDIPPPTITSCPKKLAPGAVVYMNNKFYIPGRPGLDSTVRVKGDPEFCFIIHGVSVNDCHLEGWPKRTACEIELLNGCPVWQYIDDGDKPAKCSDDRDGSPITCDHFGDPIYRDDPKTPTTGDTLETLRGFEGQPLQCGLQRDQFGPMAGYYTVAHGKGFVRACKPNNTNCGPWVGVNW